MSWSEGFTKETHPSVAKISQTMKARKIDNFKGWREKNPVNYAPIEKNDNLAEYIGVVLGDGNIEKFPRTERITIIGDAKKPLFVHRYALMTESLFRKTPAVTKAASSNAVRISLYQRYISERLGIPTGNKENLNYKIPNWIKNNDRHIFHFLRGLFESDGYLSIHLPTCTYNFAFVNNNKYLLNIVADFLIKLEFHPEIRNNAIRIRRKSEVKKLRKLISFREY